MADDDELEKHNVTARPPPGEEDVYSASTVAGAASDEMLAIIRGEKSARGIPTAPGVPKNLTVEPKSDPKLAAAAEPTSEPKIDLKPTAKPPPPPPGSPKMAYGATPLEVPVTSLASLAPTSEPPKSVEIAPEVMAEAEAQPPSERTKTTDPPQSNASRSVASASDTDASTGKGMHPAVGIVLFFVAVVAVLAALIR